MSTISRSGDFTTAQNAIARSLRIGADLSLLQAKAAGGKAALTYAEMGAATSGYLSARNELSGLQCNVDNMKKVERRLSAAENSVASLIDVATNARALFVRALGIDAPNIDEYPLNEQTRSMLDQTISSLNTRFEGEYIFGGTQTQRPPVNFPVVRRITLGGTAASLPGSLTLDLGGTPAAQLTVPIAATDTPKDVVKAIESKLQSARLAGQVSFDRISLEGTDGAAWSLSLVGAESTAPPEISVSGALSGLTVETSTISMRALKPAGTADFGYFVGLREQAPRMVEIAASTDVEMPPAADHPAFEKLIRALRIAETTTTLPATDRAAVEQALGLASEAIDELGQIRADLGAKQNFVAQLHEQVDTTATFISNTVSEREDADIATIMTSLSAQQLQLQASYMMLARLNSLSLLQFLK